MEITLTASNDALEMRIEGRLDAMTSERFLEAVCKEVEQGHRHIRLDAEGVNYLSSAGLRALLQSHRKLNALGGKFSIGKASPIVRQTISMSGLESLLVP